jgi:hypothetical protein
MPYLTFSALPTDKSPSERSDLDKKLMEAYKGVVHGSRTLDQYYYWSLTDTETKRRDDDQVVTRYLDKECKPRKLLRIDMLWLWIIDESISYKAPRSKSTSH